MAKQLQTRFLIGLASVERDKHATTRAELEQFQEARRLGALAYLRDCFDSLTAYSARGYWQGAEEPTLVVERIGPDTESARDLARTVARGLARMLEQECVGVTFATLDLELIGKD